jgi:hypothetical protein
MSRKSRSDKLSTAATKNRNLVSSILRLRMFLSLGIAASGGRTLHIFDSDENIEKNCLGYKLCEQINIQCIDQTTHDASEQQQDQDQVLQWKSKQKDQDW